jgi:hypothetical protein
MLRLVRRSLTKAFGLTIRANFISSLLMVKKLWLQGYPTNPGSGHLQFHQITFQLGGLPSSARWQGGSLLDWLSSRWRK